MLGIPARVAIGFLSPDPDGPNTWVYSARDMHAWPELYFDGAGWVRFEPTPAGRAEDVPSYTPDRRDARATSPPRRRARSAGSQRGSRATAPTESPDAAAGDRGRQRRRSPIDLAAGRSAGCSCSLLVAGGLLLPRAVRAPAPRAAARGR